MTNVGGAGIMTPLEVAKATGRVDRDPQRYENRVMPKTEPLGLPVTGMDPEVVPWYEHARSSALWLRESDRSMVTAYAILASKIHRASTMPDRDEYGMIMSPLSDKEMTQFRNLARDLGLTPTTRQKVQIDKSDEMSDDDMF